MGDSQVRLYPGVLFFVLLHLTPGLRRRQEPQRGTSGATVLIVKDYFLLCNDIDLLGLPGCLVFHHGVENRQQLAHTGYQGHFRELPGRP